MLHAEGRLSLDDAVSRYVDGVPRGEQISVRQIMSHTSGPFDFTSRRCDVRARPVRGGHAGALVSTTGDLTRFHRKLLDGTLLCPAVLAELTTCVDAPLGEVDGYGL
ncbi:hypothetical protein BE15_21755 [Sorangium cellulosum]|uniref:Beta-lactamase-related domain-containing protein n=2 Tax=Polyangiaceae TaxID=49 RepID=A0A150PZD3_SORCE|nr:hypothetical protein BE15_21755 [Sorangium cellulosum]